MVRYITRWALSSGIRKVEGHYTDDGKYFSSRAGTMGGVFVSSKEAFVTLEAAQAAAKEMALRKVASLKRQIAALESPVWRAKVAS